MPRVHCLRGIAVGLAALGLTGLPLAEAAAAAKPGYIRGDIIATPYPAAGGDDLLTAGLGAAGLQAAAAPALSDPPTAAELRRRAIYTNYRALVDVSATGGYGTPPSTGLYGPHVDKPAEAGPNGEIYGTEFLAFAKGRGGRQNVTLMVQVPSFFATGGRRPCIVTAPSSGSRGVYGAIGTAGEWGLKKGCAVAYTDKGTGIGAHDLQNDTVNTLRGERAAADSAGAGSNFTADLSDAEQAAFNAAWPNRWAWKHAHSELNPERDWGDHVLLSIDFAFWVLNNQVQRAGPRRLDPRNTLVIGSSVSNGGAASLLAAEKAPPGLIDAVVVSEPNVNPRYSARFGIKQGGGPVLRRHSRPLYDYATQAMLYQACANLANPSDLFTGLTAPVDDTIEAARCQSLHDAGLLSGADPAGWPQEAQAKLNAYGLLPEQNELAQAYWGFYVTQAVAVTYANAYARASVLDRLCGYSFAASSLAAPAPGPLAPAAANLLFPTGNGIPPTGGVGVVNDLSSAGPTYDPLSLSPSFGGRQDQNLDGAICLRSLWDGAGDAGKGRKADRQWRQRLRAGVGQIQASGRLKGIPTIILHGRNDALVAPNHSSRAYFGLNQVVDGQRARTVYYEVTNAHHLDAFNPFPGYSTRFIPLHHYFIEALDLMWAHLNEGEALPPSQVVRTTPRATATTVLTEANVPPIDDTPGPDTIRFAQGVVRIPN